MEELHQDNLPAVPKGTQEGTPVFVGNIDNLYKDKVEEINDTDDDGKPFVITIKQG